MKFWALLAFTLFTSSQAARVVLDTRLAPQPTYASESDAAGVLRDTFAPRAVPGCKDTRVTDKTPGTFIQRGVKQTAYLVHACGTSHLVIYEGTRVVRSLTNVGDAIGNVGDLNGDGVDELLLLADYVSKGSNTSRDASIVTLAGGKFRSLFDLSNAAVNECSSASAYTSAYRVTAEVGVRPLFTLERYQGDCVAGMRLMETTKRYGAAR